MINRPTIMLPLVTAMYPLFVVPGRPGFYGLPSLVQFADEADRNAYFRGLRQMGAFYLQLAQTPGIPPATDARGVLSVFLRSWRVQGGAWVPDPSLNEITLEMAYPQIEGGPWAYPGRGAELQGVI